MEYAGRGIEGEVLVGRYSRGEPACGGGPFDGEHVVGEGAAEDQFRGGKDGFGGCGCCGGEGGGGDVGEGFESRFL